ncbi:universal stress protein [Thiocapsa bogorovii]|uniref:universal stress protein n=1 Tax=Thiocapsa bogorovii TaxID=521689 RepID=UPI001E650FCB|nr:universal stress protein [Thiocapsa bogorovii]UHD18401.1 universal stress protein [Thiocapsa bogorovii]
MQDVKNILYFADGDFGPNSTLMRAIDLARQNQARLTLIDVTPESGLAADLIKRYGLADEVQQSEQRDAALTRLASEWAGDLLPHVRTPIGNPFVEVIRAVLQNDYDLLIKPVRPRTGVGAGLFGSVDMHLLRKCPCPVWIHRESKERGAEAGPTYRSILAAVDPVAIDARPLNQAIMEQATALARRDGAQLNVVHAWQFTAAEEWPGASAAGAGSGFADALRHIERHHAEALGALVADYGLGIGDGRVHFAKGHAAEQVLAHADALSSDLIVMGTIGRPREAGVFIGTTAEDVLQGSRIAVLAIKPQGFVSPVTLI